MRSTQRVPEQTAAAHGRYIFDGDRSASDWAETCYRAKYPELKSLALAPPRRDFGERRGWCSRITRPRTTPGAAFDSWRLSAPSQHERTVSRAQIPLAHHSDARGRHGPGGRVGGQGLRAAARGGWAGSHASMIVWGSERNVSVSGREGTVRVECPSRVNGVDPQRLKRAHGSADAGVRPMGRERKVLSVGVS